MPEDFAALKRRMEARGVKVTNTTPKDSQEKRYATHEEFEAAWRRLGIPVKNVTPPPAERKQEVTPLGAELLERGTREGKRSSEMMSGATSTPTVLRKMVREEDR